MAIPDPGAVRLGWILPELPQEAHVVGQDLILEAKNTLVGARIVALVKSKHAPDRLLLEIKG